MTTMETTPLSLFFIQLPIMWLVGMALVATMGGWRRMAAHFPDRPARLSTSGAQVPAGGQDPQTVQTFRMATIWIGKGSLGSTYGGCGVVEIDDEGIRLSMILPFRPFHTPMFIPWSAVKDCTRDRVVLLDRTFLDLNGTDRRLRFTDPPGQAIKDRFEAGGFAENTIPPPLRF